MSEITKKDIARVKKSLKEAYEEYRESRRQQDSKLINKAAKRITFLEATLTRYQNEING